jgi:23S rRNA maturation mini-RNase III
LPEAESGRLYNSLELAYLGDAVYDLHVRRRLLRQGGRLNQLHLRAVSQVRAGAQSRALERVEPMLTDEELEVARRARNAKQSPPHSASPPNTAARPHWKRCWDTSICLKGTSA